MDETAEGCAHVFGEVVVYDDWFAFCCETVLDDQGLFGILEQPRAGVLVVWLGWREVDLLCELCWGEIRHIG